MNRTETIKVMAVLNAAYPNFYRNLGKADYEAIVNLWTSQFADDDYETVSVAVNALISSRVEGYPPTIGAVKQKVALLRNPNEMTAQEAWGLVQKAISKSGYNAREEYYKLPQSVRALTSPQELHYWAITEGLNMEVASSNFMRSYEVRQKKEREINMMPQSIKELISATAERLAVTDKHESAEEKKEESRADVQRDKRFDMNIKELLEMTAKRMKADNGEI